MFLFAWNIKQPERYCLQLKTILSFFSPLFFHLGAVAVARAMGKRLCSVAQLGLLLLLTLSLQLPAVSVASSVCTWLTMMMIDEV